jgi:hypothetical protein
MAPAVVRHPGALTQGGKSLSEHSVDPRTRAGDPFRAAPQDQDERPCACNDGWVTMGQIALDPETGEEVEEYALYLCRRCNA